MRLHRKIAALLTAMLLVSCSGKPSDESIYRPLVFDGNKLNYEEVLNTKEHYDRVEHVLRYYSIVFNRFGETSLTLEKPIDLDLMWNFTSKAEDDEWLNTHKRN
jgi:hypothetical protein